MVDDHDEGTEPAQPAPSSPGGPSALRRFGTGFVRGLGIAAVALFTAFALANRQYVSFSWLFGATEVTEVAGERTSGGVSLIVLLVGAFVLGAVVGGVGATLRSRSRVRRSARA